MIEAKEKTDMTVKIQAALDKAIQKVIADEKARDGFLVIADSNGNIKKIPAKDL